MNAVAATLGLTTDYRASPTSPRSSVHRRRHPQRRHVLVHRHQGASEKQVDFVTYFNAGGQWVQKPGAGIDLNNACGKKVAVQATTVQETDELPAKSKKWRRSPAGGAGDPDHRKLTGRTRPPTPS